MLKEACLLVLLATTAVTGATTFQDTPQITKEQEKKVSYKPWVQTYKNSKNIVLVNAKFQQPVLAATHQAQAVKKINDFYDQQREAFNKETKSYITEAQDVYNQLGSEVKAYWRGYDFEKSYLLKRDDQKVISLEETSFSDTFGAHPNTVYLAQNFNSQTGEVLKFKDIVTDEKAAKSFIERYILETIEKDPEIKQNVFEDYKEHIKEIFSEDGWYFTEKGVMIICNEYIITPHAAGPVFFEIPYSAFKELKSEYKIA